MRYRKLIRQLILFAFLLMIGAFLYGVLVFFMQLKKEELTKMEIWVQAQTELLRTGGEEDINPVLLSVIEKNTTTPMILFSVKDSLYEGKNISQDGLTQQELARLAKSFKVLNDPIEIYFEDKPYETVYFGDSAFIKKAKYAPFVIIVVVLFFLFILHYFYNISRSNDENRLWAGMAKETAHQIGTPLSSLIGWAELLKTEKVDPSFVEEIEKDVNRLEKITNRFSKIGSTPSLEKANLVEVASAAFDYIRQRGSHLVIYSLDVSEDKIECFLNENLLNWTIENLVKNATDAIKGKGEIKLRITQNKKYAILKITDNGKGIPRSRYKTIFKPGETTKKRGWGLGLSLAKRIVEVYHHGKIRVMHSELGKGTTFAILLRKAEN